MYLLLVSVTLSINYIILLYYLQTTLDHFNFDCNTKIHTKIFKKLQMHAQCIQRQVVAVHNNYCVYIYRYYWMAIFKQSGL